VSSRTQVIGVLPSTVFLGDELSFLRIHFDHDLKIVKNFSAEVFPAVLRDGSSNELAGTEVTVIEIVRFVLAGVFVIVHETDSTVDDVVFHHIIYLAEGSDPASQTLRSIRFSEPFRTLFGLPSI